MLGPVSATFGASGTAENSPAPLWQKYFRPLEELSRGLHQKYVQSSTKSMKHVGKVIIVDYARPRWWHPLRYLFPILLAKFEPFALDLWREEITSWLTGSCTTSAHKCLFFGGLYQLVVSRR
jgi:hypothetical protein